MSGILNTAISGLRVSQAALRTAGHNISNANTEGYTRQRTEDVARPEQRLGSAGYVGSGASTQSIARITDQFVLQQLRTDTTNFNSLDKYSGNLQKIDRLFADETTGLAGGLKSFFCVGAECGGRSVVLPGAAVGGHRGGKSVQPVQYPV